MNPMIMQVGRASVIGMWGPERKERRACPEEGEQWVWGWTSWGENKALVWEGLEGSPQEAVIKVPVKCVLVSAALRG